jgi:hypothetical protein
MYTEARSVALEIFLLASSRGGTSKALQTAMNIPLQTFQQIGLRSYRAMDERRAIKTLLRP